VVVCLAVAVLLAAQAVDGFAAASRLDDHGVLTKATVVAVENGSAYFYGGTDTWADVTVVFAGAQGRAVRAHYQAPQAGGGARRGQKIQIRYDPQDPATIKPVGLGFTSVREADVWSLVLAAMALGCSAFFAVRVSRQRRPTITSPRAS
jgi:hypothetical protein